MAISLQKGGNVSLEKASPGIQKIMVGLGWDERGTDGVDFDLDASAFLVNSTGKVRGDFDFIFFNQMKSQCGSIEHTGDNLSGVGDGDDEMLLVNLATIPAEIEKVVFPVTIHEAAKRNQNFGQVSNAFIRITNDETKEEIVRYDLTEDFSVETALIFGEMYRHNNEWKFRAVGQGYQGGLTALARNYGINI